MKEKLHDKIDEELKQQNRTDSIFTIISIVINFTILFINWYFAARIHKTSSEILVFIFLIFISICISILSIIAIFKGKKLQEILQSGITLLYLDEGIEKYYPIEKLKKKSSRNIHLIILVGITGILAIGMPLMLFTN